MTFTEMNSSTIRSNRERKTPCVPLHKRVNLNKAPSSTKKIDINDFSPRTNASSALYKNTNLKPQALSSSMRLNSRGLSRGKLEEKTTASLTTSTVKTPLRLTLSRSQKSLLNGKSTVDIPNTFVQSEKSVLNGKSSMENPDTRVPSSRSRSSTGESSLSSPYEKNKILSEANDIEKDTSLSRPTRPGIKQPLPLIMEPASDLPASSSFPSLLVASEPNKLLVNSLVSPNSDNTTSKFRTVCPGRRGSLNVASLVDLKPETPSSNLRPHYTRSLMDIREDKLLEAQRPGLVQSSMSNKRENQRRTVQMRRESMDVQKSVERLIRMSRMQLRDKDSKEKPGTLGAQMKSVSSSRYLRRRISEENS